MTRVALHPGGLIPETVRLQRLEVGWQREARSEALLGDLERVLERGASFERWDRTRQEAQREPLRSEPPSSLMAVPPVPPVGDAPTWQQPLEGIDASVAGAPVSAGRSSGAAQAPAPRSKALIALVERIEACVREGRPALSLELSGTGWRVDLERHALGGVVVRLQTRPGGQAPDLEALRAELHARGVTLRGLSCGS